MIIAKFAGMNIALIGYGKMGKTIEQIALSRGHRISFVSDKEGFSSEDLANSDVAIEFTIPEAAPANILKCSASGTPVVVGTTGWYDQFNSIESQIKADSSALLTATNFSIGVNLFFELNKKLAKMMNAYPGYEVSMEEIHHTQKLDAPSGTAITLAEGLLANLDRKNDWVSLSADNKPSSDALALQIESKRIDEVPGTHQVTYRSEIDDIEIVHTAHNRQGFALGAVMAAEWLAYKKGVYTISDMLGINIEEK